MHPLYPFNHFLQPWWDVFIQLFESFLKILKGYGNFNSCFDILLKQERVGYNNNLMDSHQLQEIILRWPDFLIHLLSKLLEQK